MEGEAFTQGPLQNMLTQLVQKKEEEHDRHLSDIFRCCTPQCQETIFVRHPNQFQGNSKNKEKEGVAPEGSDSVRRLGRATLSPSLCGCNGPISQEEDSQEGRSPSYRNR